MTGDPYTDNLLKYTGMSQGWLCPRCQRVNAPWAAVCPCSHVYIASTPAPTQPYYPDSTGDPLPEPCQTGDPLPGEHPYTTSGGNDDYIPRTSISWNGLMGSLFYTDIPGEIDSTTHLET